VRSKVMDGLSLLRSGTACHKPGIEIGSSPGA
jgi:hypothetical protein